jgi:hypothetical protein
VPYKDPAKREAMAKVYKARWYQKNKLVTKERTRANKKSKRWFGMRLRPRRPAHTAGRHTPAV